MLSHRQSTIPSTQVLYFNDPIHRCAQILHRQSTLLSTQLLSSAFPKMVFASVSLINSARDGKDSEIGDTKTSGGMKVWRRPACNYRKGPAGRSAAAAAVGAPARAGSASTRPTAAAAVAAAAAPEAGSAGAQHLPGPATSACVRHPLTRRLLLGKKRACQINL